jgi:hypothetical protein
MILRAQHFWRWCVTRAQLLAFITFVGVTLIITQVYNAHQRRDLVQAVNRDIQSLGRELGRAVPGAHVKLRVVRSKDGGLLLVQTITRYVRLPPPGS